MEKFYNEMDSSCRDRPPNRKSESSTAKLWKRHFCFWVFFTKKGSSCGCPSVKTYGAFEEEIFVPATYTKYLKERIFPWARATYGNKWWWQQDGASCHTAKITQEFLAAETPGFFEKEDWPPHSPDLSPLDFAIFGRLKGMLSGVQYRNKDQLKSAIESA